MSQWACSVCTYLNHPALLKCEICDSDRESKPLQSTNPDLEFEKQLTQEQSNPGDQPAKKLCDELNLRIFSEQERQKCNHDCDDPIEGCIVVKRLVIVLAYCSRLDVQNSTEGQEIFIAFINGVYPHILDDYAHLLNKHTNLEAINNALRANKVFDVCQLTKCACTSRHHLQETTKTPEQSMDATVQFYSQVMDSLHFYLLHLFEYGLRTP
eukprot:833902_1